VKIHQVECVPENDTAISTTITVLCYNYCGAFRISMPLQSDFWLAEVHETETPNQTNSYVARFEVLGAVLMNPHICQNNPPFRILKISERFHYTIQLLSNIIENTI
jgi:hypothetical protein